ncbi:hypothetical protein ISI08_06665 [Burkholderia pseudomallei]|nr:hypothetical protein [Burkholderia pseudomallei]MBF3685931.1 hypothetical protein [Burkholderia pseudomallei]MBF3703766.1 hypothetical protein [Burkholderia pseudomallei]MBF4038797.1 hypothetical protein [Burkholderia pseudomallei]MBF4053739.1 hypothetical protein [Burkholderia pseudomallei]QTB46750.1 hypothetical protein J3B47_22055 [Burkholderia pseudomallei]
MSSRVVACRRVSSRVVACRRVSSRVVACRRVSSRVVAGRRGSSRVVAGRRGSSRVVAGRRGSSRVVAGRRGFAFGARAARRRRTRSSGAPTVEAIVFQKDSMKKILAVIAFLAVVGWLAATTTVLHAPSAQPCTDAWFDAIDKQFDITDNAGHGPDPGSGEWLGVVERKAKLPESGQLTEQQRCEAIQRELSQRTYLVNRRLGLKLAL